MKLHSSLTPYLGGILILISSALFISHRYVVLGPALSILMTLLFSVFLYFAFKLIAQKIENIFLEITTFILIGSILSIISNISDAELFEYYLKNIFSLNSLIWSSILMMPSFLVFQILKKVYFVKTSDGICEFQNFWGEGGFLKLGEVRILEHKIIPFFIPFLLPAFFFGKFKMASITWEDQDMESYSISFIGKSSIEGKPVLDHLSSQAISLGNINIRRY